MCKNQNLISTVLLSMTIYLIGNANIFAQPGYLDASFGNNGIAITPIGSFHATIHEVAIQSDGKIVVVGNSTFPNFIIMRHNVDGSLDNSFDFDGIVNNSAIGSLQDEARCVAIQNDGKIIVAGASSSGIDFDFSIARYNSNGSLDSTFSNDGKTLTSFGTGQDVGNSACIQNDGKIIVGGITNIGPDSDFGLVRYNSDGSIDSTFDFDGKVTTDFGMGEDQGNSLCIQTDGKIILGGYGYNGTNYDLALVRYNSDGSLDASFDIDGKILLDFSISEEFGNAIKIQDNGKILMAGEHFDGINYDFALVRFNNNGNLDSTFGINGIVITNFNGQSSGASSIGILDSTKIIVGGTAQDASISQFAIARYSYNGSIDSTFDFDGKITTTIGIAAIDYSYSLAIQPDNKIILVGSVSDSVFAIARYNNVCPSINYAQSITIEYGDSILVGNNIYQIHGTYIDTIITPNYCDSIITTNLFIINSGNEAISEQSMHLSIYPNPLINSTTLEIKNASFDLKEVELKIYNSLGSEVFGLLLNSSIQTINLNLTNGIYFYNIVKDKKIIIGSSGKLIIQSQ